MGNRCSQNDSGSERGSYVLPHGREQLADAEMDGPARVPISGQEKEPGRSGPSACDSHRPPMKADHEEQHGHEKLDDTPAEPAVGTAHGDMNPTVHSVQQHDADAGTKEHEDPARFVPLSPQQQTDCIASNKSQICTDAHSEECKNRERPQKMPAKLDRILFELT